MRTERNLPYVNAFGTVDISSAKSVDDALELAGLNWEVEQRKLYDAYGNEYPKYRANVRTLDDKMLGMVTEKYHIVQNSEAFNFVNNLVDEGFEFDRAGEFRDGSSIWVMGNLPKTSILGDDIANNVVFVNSHDGSSGVKVMMTPVRLICSNMLNLATKKADRIWASKHTGSITTKLEEAKYTLGLANHYISALNEEAERLVDIKVDEATLEAIFDAMFPIDKDKDTERKIRNIVEMKNNLFRCYDESDIAKFKGTAWGAVNAFADMVDHREPNRNTANFYENNWWKLINGEKNLDEFHKRVGR